MGGAGGWTDPGGIYLFKFNNKNTRAMCEVCSLISFLIVLRQLETSKKETELPIKPILSQR